MLCHPSGNVPLRVAHPAAEDRLSTVGGDSSGSGSGDWRLEIASRRFERRIHGCVCGVSMEVELLLLAHHRSGRRCGSRRLAISDSHWPLDLRSSSSMESARVQQRFQFVLWRRQIQQRGIELHSARAGYAPPHAAATPRPPVASPPRQVRPGWAAIAPANSSNCAAAVGGLMLHRRRLL